MNNNNNIILNETERSGWRARVSGRRERVGGI